MTVEGVKQLDSCCGVTGDRELLPVYVPLPDAVGYMTLLCLWKHTGTVDDLPIR